MVIQPGTGRLRRGMTLVETMTVLMVFSLMAVMTVQFALSATSAFRKTTKVGTEFAEDRRALETIMADIRMADMSLVRYPTDEVDPAFLAAEDRTLILRFPVISQDGEIDYDDFQIVIYRLDQQEGAELFSLNRYTATVIDGKQSTAVLERTVSDRVVAAQFTMIAHEIFYGDTGTKDFNLTSENLGSNEVIQESVLVGGLDRIVDGKAKLVKGVVTFVDKAPNWSVPIDVTYRTSPTYFANGEGGNAADSIGVRLVVQSEAKASSGKTVTRDIPMSSRSSLLNK